MGQKLYVLNVSLSLSLREGDALQTCSGTPASCGAPLPTVAAPLGTALEALFVCASEVAKSREHAAL